jgi:hypothetical protein
MPWVGFEPTIPAFEQAKTFHALDRAANVMGIDLTTVSQRSQRIRTQMIMEFSVGYVFYREQF